MAAVAAASGSKRPRVESADDSGRAKRLFGALLLGHLASRAPEHLLTVAVPRLRWRPAQPDAAFLAAAARQRADEAASAPPAAAAPRALAAARSAAPAAAVTATAAASEVLDVPALNVAPMASAADAAQLLPQPPPPPIDEDAGFLDYS